MRPGQGPTAASSVERRGRRGTWPRPAPSPSCPAAAASRSGGSRPRPSSSRGRCRWPPASSAAPGPRARPCCRYRLLGRWSSSTEAVASLTCRNSGSWPSRPWSSTIHARVPTLPTPTTLRATSTISEPLEQEAPVVLQRSPVGAELLADRVLRLIWRQAVVGAEVPQRNHDRRLADDPVLAVDHLGELGQRLQAVSRPGLGQVLLGALDLLGLRLARACACAAATMSSCARWAYQMSSVRICANSAIASRYAATDAVGHGPRLGLAEAVVARRRS